jgi:hypothetical protein
MIIEVDKLRIQGSLLVRQGNRYLKRWVLVMHR